jgi:hypothetical protein
MAGTCVRVRLVPAGIVVHNAHGLRPAEPTRRQSEKLSAKGWRQVWISGQLIEPCVQL